MEIEEQKQIVVKKQKYIESETDKIVKANILKYKKKKQVKVQWYPKIPKKIKDWNSEPTYIYFILKIFKSYEDEDYNRHKQFGYVDAGIGRIEQIYLDKINKTIDLNLKLFSSGYEDFQYLIQIFKNRQDALYFDLANLLEQYQMWIKNHISYICNAFSNINVFNKTLQDQIDSAYPEFESAVKVWANETFTNELFEIEIGTVRLESLKPVLIKKIFSQNLMMLLGGEVYEIYQNLIQYNLKETLNSFLEGGEYNGRIQLEKMLILIKRFMDRSLDESVFQDEIFTLDGISMPVKKTLNIYFYDQNEKKVTKQPKLHFFCITLYNVEPSWIKYLIETRQQLSQYKDQIQLRGLKVAQNNQFYKNFEFICKQEYFLEKFNYVKQIKNN